MHDNTNDYVNVLSKFQCGFWKDFGAQNCPLYISILSNISKIYEWRMHDNTNDYVNVLSKFQCGFWKDFGAQNCPLYMVKTIRKTRDNQGVFAAVMTDLSKAFDCISFPWTFNS